MNLNHLTDKELIDHTLKYETDPVRVRLAGVMDRMPGFILDSLEFAGMDPETCFFENTWDPGQYITHLESELGIYQDENAHLRKELEELKARTVMDLIGELKQEIRTAEFCAKEARREAEQARENEKIMKSKLDMWAIMNR